MIVLVDLNANATIAVLLFIFSRSVYCVSSRIVWRPQLANASVCCWVLKLVKKSYRDDDSGYSLELNLLFSTMLDPKSDRTTTALVAATFATLRNFRANRIAASLFLH